jgi:hypothetical protein
MHWLAVCAYAVGVGTLFAAPFYWLARWKNPPLARVDALGIAAIIFVPLVGICIAGAWLSYNATGVGF